MRCIGDKTASAFVKKTVRSSGGHGAPQECFSEPHKLFSSEKFVLGTQRKKSPEATPSFLRFRTFFKTFLRGEPERVPSELSTLGKASMFSYKIRSCFWELKVLPIYPSSTISCRLKVAVV